MNNTLDDVVRQGLTIGLLPPSEMSATDKLSVCYNWMQNAHRTLGKRWKRRLRRGTHEVFNMANYSKLETYLNHG